MHCYAIFFNNQEEKQVKKSVTLLAVISIFISFTASGKKIKLFQFEGNFFRETATNDFANTVNIDGKIFKKMTADDFVKIKLSRTWYNSSDAPADQWAEKKYPGKEFQMPGKNLLDLDEVFAPAKPKESDTTCLYNEFEAPEDGFALIGMDCDRWFEAKCNGTTYYATFKSGNLSGDYKPENNVFLIKVRKGSNLLAVKVRRGKSSWKFACSELSPQKIANKNVKETDRYISDRVPDDFYRKIEKGEYATNIYPVFADRETWEKARQSPYADIIIQEADAIINEAIPPLYYSDYKMFNANGDRAKFQNSYFQRRKNLGLLTLAMCLTGNKAKYMTKVIDYTVAIMEEWSWCLPAHASWSHDRLERWKFCDLFCAETGAVMAQVHALLADEFDKVFEGLSELIRTKTLERTVYTTLYSGFEHWWLTAAQPANWTPWCSYNNLAINLMLEKDPAKRVFATKEFLGATSRYINHCPADGYSPEGPSYYNKSNLMVFRTLYLLHKAVPGSMDKIWADPKIRAMVEFIVNLQMGAEHQLTFADSRPEIVPNLSFILPAGKIFDSQELLGLGINRLAKLGTEGSHLKESLALLFDMPEKLPEKCPVGKSVSLFKNRLVILRSAGFTLSLKGGYNNEPHNHNDLGHFSIFNEGKPVVVDAGTGVYSRIHFSTQRYTLWNTRGSGHNAPVFGKYEQVNGWNYTARFELKDNIIICDLSKAYPAQAG